jgi:hypothetical protein
VDTFKECDGFLEFTHNLEDIDNQSSVCVIESDSVNGSEQFLEIVLDHVWIRSYGKNLE